jgi:Protein of unknown function (DUF3558)
VKSAKLVVLAMLAISALAACSGPAATAPAVIPSTPAGPSTAPTSAPAGSSTAPASSTPAAVAGSVDLCGLISPADLKTVTGDTYGAGVLDTYGECTWRVGGASVNDGKGQLIVAIQAITIDYVKSSYGSGGADATVSGHAAFWNPTQGLQSMWIDIGGGNALVLSFDPIADSTKGFAQKLAEIAVSKM